jgi:glycosyltransferase involved in cell wall biosynthesis
MSKITAVVLTRNEEEMIADCLDSLTFCSEILVIDSQSTDMTVDIARRYKAKIIEDTTDDFSEKRNKGLHHAKNEWLLYVDADERVSPQLKMSIEHVVESEELKSGYEVTRRNFYLGNHEWPTTERFIRLFQKDKLLTWKGKLHESPQVKGDIGTLDGDLLHFTHRTLSGMLEKTISWSEVEAQLRYDSNHPKMTWWRFPRVMFRAFADSYVGQKGWKAGTAGVVESMYQSFSMFITYARLWEMQQEKKR